MESHWQIRGTQLGDVILTLETGEGHPHITLEFGKTASPALVNRVAYRGEVSLTQLPHSSDWIVNLSSISRVSSGGAKSPTKAAIQAIEEAAVALVRDWVPTMEGHKSFRALV